MNYFERPSALEESANAEVTTVFAKNLKQFKTDCETAHNIERNLRIVGNDAFKAALQSSGSVIQTDDGIQWQHDVGLMKNISICHRRTSSRLEFAVVECLPLPPGEMKEVLNSGHSVREVLKAFVRDQRQVLNLWKNDLTEQVKEFLADKYPHQNMSRVVESFEIKMARAISEKQSLAQNQRRGIRI